ncbi:MAG: hypothetical protein JO108_04930 [Acidobacteriaceae bacterium]|nr:hypothetical protein [Acidobacteriaceae bacterium]
MAILVVASGNYGQVLQDIYDITGGDGGLGEGDSGNPAFILITYQQDNSGQFGPDRINDLINNVACNVVVVGDNPTTVVAPYKLCQVRGVTGPLTGGQVNVVYETTQCNGEGYFVFDADGNQIPDPNTAILFHELSHAYHKCIGDYPGPGAAAEFQAITDENGLRAQLGLPLRDPNNNKQAGCTDCGAGGQPPPSNNCLIATAALGSPLAPDVVFLRHIRDSVLRCSKLGCQLFDEFWAQYYTFSPSIADKMAVSSPFRNQITRLAVQPLVQFLTWAYDYVQGGWQADDFAARVESDLRVSAQTLSTDSFTLSSLENLLGKQRNDQYIVWGLLVPLRLYWAAATDLERSPDKGVIGMRVKAQIGDWLSAVPIPAGYRSLSESEIHQDLVLLNERIFTSPELRQVFEKRLWQRLRGCGDN